MIGIILFVLMFGASAQAATRLGLHVTSEELAVWRARAASGPYRTSGDVSTNSPGDWTSIQSRAATFAASPLSDNWQGQTAGGAWAPDGHSCTYTEGSGEVVGCVPGFSQGINILAAGFATMIDPVNLNRASQVRTALLAQIAYTGTAWLNTAKWPNSQLGDAYSWMIAQWLTKFVLAYDYVRIVSPGTFSSTERNNIEQWFSDAAFYWARNANHLIVNNAFPNRNTEHASSVAVGGLYPTDNYVNLPAGSKYGGSRVTYFNCIASARGPLSANVHSLWNNRSGTQIQFAAHGSLLNGTFPNDAQTQTWAKMWFRETMTYAVFPDGTLHDWVRGGDDPTNRPNQGWVYGAIVTGSMTSVADIFARNGDTSLYDYSTSAGWTFSDNPAGYNANTVGGPKTLLKTMQAHSNLVPQRTTLNPNWRNGDTSAACSDSNTIIDTQTSLGNYVHENHYIAGNLYYRDATIKTMYMRTATGASAYPASPVTNSNPWGGVNGIYPGVLFMFGQMEDNAANPFLDGEPPVSGSGALKLEVRRRLQ